MDAPATLSLLKIGVYVTMYVTALLSRGLSRF